jgi:Spy/CpxP family protein refolding chaperone
MRFHRFLLILAATALLAQVPPAATAGRGRQAGAGVAAVKKALDLSDQQVQQLVQLRREEQKALQPVREQMREKRQALQTARQSASPNPTAIGQLVIDLQGLQKEVQAKNEDYHAKALALLDDAQKAKLKDLQQAARARPMVQGGTLLNLLLPPARGAGRGVIP